MIKKLPKYYRKSEVVKNVYEVIKRFLTDHDELIEKYRKNTFLMTADDLKRFETDYKLSSINSDTETKRARILSRIRNSGTLTVDALKNIAKGFNFEIEVNERFSEYTVDINVVDRYGIPKNIDEFKLIVEELKPAHIAVEYNYKYNTWAVTHEKVGLWGNAQNYTWGHIRDYDNAVFVKIDGNDVYLTEDNANGYIVFKDDKAYARLINKGVEE